MHQGLLLPLRKKALYLATHRGTREADLVLGKFAQEIVDHLQPQDLTFFLSFLELPDETIMNWLLKGTALPQGLDASKHPVLKTLQVFVGEQLLEVLQGNQDPQEAAQFQSLE